MKHECKSNLGHYLTYVLIMGIFNLAGCDGGESSIDEQVTSINPASLECTVKMGDGSEYFRCTSSEKGFMITRGNELLLRITAEEKEFIAYNANAAIAGRVELSTEGFNLQGSNKVKLFEFNRQADGDWKLKYADDSQIYRVKLRDYGYEIEGANDSSLFKAKRKGDKRSLRDSSENSIAYSKDSFSELALVPFAFQSVMSEDLCLILFVCLARNSHVN
tara:strand:- start:795 stop:1451 length:657 start_codon:yes stop_codon:yes gene_type:complete